MNYDGTYKIEATEWCVKISAYFMTRDEATAAAASFPKAAGFKSYGVSGLDQNPDGSYTHWNDRGGIQAYAKIKTDGVNGGRNETGIKRINRALAELAKAGIAVEFATPYSNSFTADQLAEVLGKAVS